MKTNKKMSLCVLAMICLAFTFMLVQPSFAQQGQQYSLTITVKDGVTGKAAQGVTTKIETSTGTLVQNLGTVSGPTTVTLPAGTYVIDVQLPIFGIQFTTLSSTITLNQASTVGLVVSAYIIPIQYLPLLIYIIIIIIILIIIYLIIISIIRRARQKDLRQKKPT